MLLTSRRRSASERMQLAQMYVKAILGMIVFTIVLTVILVGSLFYAEFLQTHLSVIPYPDHIVWLELIVLLRVIYWLCNGPLGKFREELADFRYGRTRASTDLTLPKSARRFSNKVAAEVIILLIIVAALTTAVYFLVEHLRGMLSLRGELGEIGFGLLILIVLLPNLLLMDVVIGPSLAILEENRAKEKEQKSRQKGSRKIVRDQAREELDAAEEQYRVQKSNGQLEPDERRAIDAQWYKLFVASLDFISFVSAVILALYGAQALVGMFFYGATPIYVGWFLWLVFALMTALTVRLTLWKPFKTLLNIRTRGHSQRNPEI